MALEKIKHDAHRSVPVGPEYHFWLDDEDASYDRYLEEEEVSTSTTRNERKN